MTADVRKTNSSGLSAIRKLSRNGIVGSEGRGIVGEPEVTVFIRHGLLAANSRYAR